MSLPDPQRIALKAILYELETNGEEIERVWMHNLHGPYWDRQTVINGETFDQALERHTRERMAQELEDAVARMDHTRIMADIETSPEFAHLSSRDWQVIRSRLIPGQDCLSAVREYASTIPDPRKEKDFQILLERYKSLAGHPIYPVPTSYEKLLSLIHSLEVRPSRHKRLWRPQ